MKKYPALEWERELWERMGETFNTVVDDSDREMSWGYCPGRLYNEVFCVTEYLGNYSHICKHTWYCSSVTKRDYERDPDSVAKTMMMAILEDCGLLNEGGDRC